jgi:WhiB family redox-sensing transcriptional regulator
MRQDLAFNGASTLCRFQPAAQNSPIPTSGPTITLASGENMELSWQERALCAQTDPEGFLPRKGWLNS